MAVGLEGKSSRVDWIDATRGVAIVLVVLGHVWRGVNKSGLIPDAALFHALDSAIYCFHMPFFFAVSGLFLEGSISKRGMVGSFVQRSVQLLLPLIIWSYILAVFLLAAGHLSNSTPPSISSLWYAPFPPRDTMWFLWAMFLVQAVATLVVMLPGPRMAILIGALVLALVAAILVSPHLPDLIAPAVLYLPYFLTGVLAKRLGWPRGASIPLGVLGLAVFAICEVMAFLLAPDVASAAGVALSIGAVIGFTLFASRALNGSRVSVLTRLGVVSLGIYVTHTIFTAATRIVLLKLGVTSLPVHVVTGTGVGLLAAFAVVLIVEKMRLGPWVGFGPYAFGDKAPASRVKAAIEP